MNRAKKRKISPLVPTPVVAEEPESEEEPTPAPAPKVAAPAALTRARPACKSLMKDAEHEYRKAERKWHKTAETHFSNTYSQWSEPSIVARVRARLQKADDELDAARVEYHLHRRRYFAHRTLMALEAAHSKQPREDLRSRMQLWDVKARAREVDLRALDNRWNEPGERVMEAQKGFFAANKEGPGAVDMVARQLGLAQAWGLMYASDL